jgi:WD40 repeat protein
LADAKLVGQFRAPGPIRSLAFSPNNLTLAGACQDKSLLAWNVAYNPGQAVPAEFGKLVATYAHAAAVTDVAFAPDSIQFYSSGQDKTIKAWRFASDAPIKSFAHPNRVDAVAFNSANTLLVTGCPDGNLRIWDVAKGQPTRTIAAHLAMNQPSPIYSVAWSPDDKQILSASYDRSLKLWDANSGALVRELKPYKEKDFEKGHRDAVYCGAFSPDGKTIASGSYRTIKLWNVADGNLLREFANPNLKPPASAPGANAPGSPEAHPGWVHGLRFTADGKFLISAGTAPRFQGYLAVWNVADGRLLHGAALPLGNIYSVAVSPDGTLLALACGPRALQAQDSSGYILKMPEGVK